MNLVPNQAYPDRAAWVQVEGIFANGWIGEGTRFLRLMIDGNNVSVSGRMVIGSSRRIAGYLPGEFRPPVNQSLPAFIQNGPPCIMELWADGAIALSFNSLGMTEAEMLTAYAGRDVYVYGSYPRRGLA